jgi:hypothetical protein
MQRPGRISHKQVTCQAQGNVLGALRTGKRPHGEMPMGILSAPSVSVWSEYQPR